jgi:hypothetical protein
MGKPQVEKVLFIGHLPGNFAGDHPADIECEGVLA